MHAEQIIATSLAVDLASESANPWELEKLVDSNPNFEQLLFIYPTNANILVFRLEWEVRNWPPQEANSLAASFPLGNIKAYNKSITLNYNKY